MNDIKTIFPSSIAHKTKENEIKSSNDWLCSNISGERDSWKERLNYLRACLGKTLKKNRRKISKNRTRVIAFAWNIKNPFPDRGKKGIQFELGESRECFFMCYDFFISLDLGKKQSLLFDVVISMLIVTCCNPGLN